MVICAGVAVYLWMRPFGGDLYPDWLAERAFVQGRDPYASFGLPFPFQYPPGFLLIFAPIGLVETFEPVVKGGFEILNGASIVGAALLCLRLFDQRWRAPRTAVLLAALSLSPPVLITMIQGNSNGILLGCMCAFLLLASRHRWVGAGLVLGLGVAIKPLILPVAVVAAVRRRWVGLAMVLVVPVGLSVVVLLVNAAAWRFFTDSVPYLLAGESGIGQSNTSLVGAVALLGLPPFIGVFLRVGVLGLVVAVLWKRSKQDVDPRLKLVELATMSMLAALLCFSFSSEYYAIYFLPLIVSVVLPGSVMRQPVAWLGVFLVDSPDLFLFYRIGRHYGLGPAPGTVRSTLGFLVLLGAFALVTHRGASSRRRVGGRAGLSDSGGS